MIKKLLATICLLATLVIPAFGKGTNIEKPVVLDSTMIESSISRYFVAIKNSDGKYIKSNIISLNMYPTSGLLVYQDYIGNKGSIQINNDRFQIVAGTINIQFIHEEKPYWCWEDNYGRCNKF